MKFGIKLSQPSTIRGGIWLIIFVIGLVMVFMGKDVSQLLLLGAGVVGALGFGVKDETSDDVNKYGNDWER